MAGYSGTPLARKLGIKEGHSVAAVNAPSTFPGLVSELPDGAVLLLDPPDRTGPFDVAILFAREPEPLRSALSAWRERIRRDGGLWAAWPKKSSSLESELDKAEVQRTGLDAGLVDNKVCAVDEDWSALRFVYRLTDR